MSNVKAITRQPINSENPLEWRVGQCLFNNSYFSLIGQDIFGDVLVLYMLYVKKKTDFYKSVFCVFVLTN